MQKWQILFLSMFIIIVNFGSVTGQTTEFTYQGSIKDGGTAANGSYDFEFALFDMLAGGNQIGSTVAKNTVPVTAGIFTVKLDFGSVFPGANRYLEIRARLAGQPGITTLAPRQLLNSLPYSVKSLTTDTAATATNALQLGGVAANQFVVTTDPRMTNARQPTPGSANYIQNQNLGSQLASNFNISGDGTVGGDLTVGGSLNLNIVNATQYNIGGTRVLYTVGTNTFVGVLTGLSNIGGGNNSFFGSQAGQANVGGSSNSFFGRSAGLLSTGSSNSFFGALAGDSNTSGASNSFFGISAGTGNSTGGSNTFVGRESGFFNSTGSNNTALGTGAGPTSGGLTFATAIGAGATVSESDAIVLGRSTGDDIVRIPGLAVVAGELHVASRVRVGTLGSAGLTTHLCLNGVNDIAACSSSLRYKTNIGRFSSGLNVIKQLSPISYNWKDGGMQDIGFGAEDIEKIDSRFVFYNAKGEVEGVKYDRFSTLFVNAFMEQQQQIDAQQKQIEALKAIVCSIKPEEEICTK